MSPILPPALWALTSCLLLGILLLVAMLLRTTRRLLRMNQVLLREFHTLTSTELGHLYDAVGRVESAITALRATIHPPDSLG